ISLTQRIISATCGSILSSLVVTPFDLLKTRIQTNHPQQTFTSIHQLDGVKGLWRGLKPTLLMSTPSTVIYYIGYEKLKNIFVDKGFGGTSPLIAGCVARSLTATVISPLELMKTRIQHDSVNPIKEILNLVRHDGITSLWRGLPPTLWRDVPFSGIYWLGYDFIKTNYDNVLLDKVDPFRENPFFDRFIVALFSGALSGM
ncbi:hypothetical protein HK099_003444, partial [Clydaea vesicula]